jgi:uncharacterized integral membrane protein (TIGR02327 family)
MTQESYFAIARIILFFIATPMVYKALQAIDFSRVFRANATEQIRLIMMILSVILGYLFIDAIVNLVELAADLF